MVDGSEEAARGRQICGERQGRHGRKIFVGARGVGELDSYRVNTALGYVVVELLDGAFGLHTLVKANEANPLGEACNTTGQRQGLRYCFQCLHQCKTPSSRLPHRNWKLF